jgi:hypothetical protein
MKIVADISKNMCTITLSAGNNSKGKQVWRVKGGNAKEDPGSTISDVLLEQNPNVVTAIDDFIAEAVGLSMSLYEYE